MLCALWNKFAWILNTWNSLKPIVTVKSLFSFDTLQPKAFSKVKSEESARWIFGILIPWCLLAWDVSWIHFTVSSSRRFVKLSSFESSSVNADEFLMSLKLIDLFILWNRRNGFRSKHNVEWSNFLRSKKLKFTNHKILFPLIHRWGSWE